MCNKMTLKGGREVCGASCGSPIFLVPSCHRGNVGPFPNGFSHFLVLLLSSRIKQHEKFCTVADGLWNLTPSCLLLTQMHGPLSRLSWPPDSNLSASEKHFTIPPLFSAPSGSPQTLSLLLQSHVHRFICQS